MTKFLVPIISILAQLSWAQDIAPTTAPAARIATFYQDKAAAISYMFDDGLRDQSETAAPMLERLGFHGTFFIIANCVAETETDAAKRYAAHPGAPGTISWPQLKALSQRGHEIANHSWSHQRMTQLEDAALTDEIVKAQQLLAERIGKKPLTFCYPGNGRNDHVKAAVLKTHIAARDFQRGFGKPDFTAETANQWADEIVRKKQWGVVMIHGITAGYDAFSSARVLENHWKYVKQNEERIWVDTFLNVTLYNHERAHSQIIVSAAKEKTLTFTVESTLDPAIYNFPLTIVFQVNGAAKVDAFRGNQPLPARANSGHIFVDCVPGSEPVVVSWQ